MNKYKGEICLGTWAARFDKNNDLWFSDFN